MGLLDRQYQPLRRKADLADWDRTVESIALALCPETERQAYEWRRKQFSRKNGKIKLFPVWRKYRKTAIKVAIVQRNLPFLKRFPLAFSRILSEVIF